jgi:hypothetical protein
VFFRGAFATASQASAIAARSSRPRLLISGQPNLANDVWLPAIRLILRDKIRSRPHNACACDPPSNR